MKKNDNYDEIDFKELVKSLKIRIDSDDNQVMNIREVYVSLEFDGEVISKDSIKIKG